jgi:general secretion pathway protein C
MNSTSVFGDLRGLTPGTIASHLSPRLPQIATWVLVVLIGIQGALIAKSFFGNPVLDAASEAAPPAAAGPVRRPVDVQSIVNAHLFGEASAEEAPTNPEQAPQTTLTLVLAGTIASNDPKKGLGIIGETAANAKVYSVGESIPGGATLHAVYLDRVILDRSGTLEALLLPRQQPLSGAGNQPRAQLTDAGPRGMSSTPADRVRRMIAQDPGSVAEIMRPQPVFANGQQRGYRVYPGRNRVSFQQLGLQPGDLVTAINGTPLDDPARGMEIFRSIGSASQVKVTIERKGRQQELTLNMAQLADQAQALPGNENLLPSEPPSTDPSEQ